MNSRQLFQLCCGATTGAPGVWPAPGSSVAPANGGAASSPPSSNPKDSSAELNGLRRHMAAIVSPANTCDGAK